MENFTICRGPNTNLQFGIDELRSSHQGSDEPDPEQLCIAVLADWTPRRQARPPRKPAARRSATGWRRRRSEL